MDYGAGPSRPPPVPYDDPYSDSYGLPESSSPSVPVAEISAAPIETPEGFSRGEHSHGYHGSRERGRGRGADRRRGGRGRGRGRGRGGGGGGGGHQGGSHSPLMVQQPEEGYESRSSRPLSPTSMAIARATGQYSDGSTYAMDQQAAMNHTQGVPGENHWPYQQYQDPYNFNFAYQSTYVQPHINPRFASRFGMNFGYPGQQQQQQQ